MMNKDAARLVSQIAQLLTWGMSLPEMHEQLQVGRAISEEEFFLCYQGAIILMKK